MKKEFQERNGRRPGGMAVSRLIILLAFVMSVGFGCHAEPQYFKDLKEKDLPKMKSAQFRAEQTDPDGYNFRYTVSILTSGVGTPRVAVETPSCDKRWYTVTNFAGSYTRKEFWLKANDGKEATMVVSIEQDPKARNANLYRVTVTEHPDKRFTKRTVNATMNTRYSQWYTKESSGRVGFSQDLITEGSVKDWNVGLVQDLFKWLDMKMPK